MAGQMTLSGIRRHSYLKWYQLLEQTQCHWINVDLSRYAFLEGIPSGGISSSPLIRPFCRTVAVWVSLRSKTRPRVKIDVKVWCSAETRIPMVLFLLRLIRPIRELKTEFEGIFKAIWDTSAVSRLVTIYKKWLQTVIQNFVNPCRLRSFRTVINTFIWK